MRSKSESLGMNRDCLLHYIIQCINKQCEIKRVYTPAGYCGLVKVDSCDFFFSAADIHTIKVLEEVFDWASSCDLPARLEECLRTGKDIKKEVRDE